MTTTTNTGSRYDILLYYIKWYIICICAQDARIIIIHNVIYGAHNPFLHTRRKITYLYIHILLLLQPFPLIRYWILQIQRTYMHIPIVRIIIIYADRSVPTTANGSSKIFCRRLFGCAYNVMYITQYAPMNTYNILLLYYNDRMPFPGRLAKPVKTGKTNSRTVYFLRFETLWQTMHTDSFAISYGYGKLRGNVFVTDTC